MTSPLSILPMAQPVPEGAGSFCLPSLSQDFLCGHLETKIGKIPRVESTLQRRDKFGHYRVRWNIGRDDFIVEPGIYALGNPDTESHVLVTANYKLTFDLLRQVLNGFSCWILVLDTKGINVWCAAGKGTFGTEELVDRIQASRLHDVVNHRRLIVPQLGATGVAAFRVKQYSGFSVQYGPVMLDDLPEFFSNGNKVHPDMRLKKFPLQERIVLIPVEIMQALRQGLPVILFFLLTAGLFGSSSFFTMLSIHGLPPSIAVLSGIVGGTILTPLLLPWIPGKAFSFKGAVCGLLLFVLVLLPLYGTDVQYSPLEKSSWLFINLAVSSWFGMAFTGASTFTSLNGVRKEMLIGMPLQFVSLLGGTIMWLTSLWLSH